jgi:hypothetical protein
MLCASCDAHVIKKSLQNIAKRLMKHPKLRRTVKREAEYGQVPQLILHTQIRTRVNGPLATQPSTTTDVVGQVGCFLRYFFEDDKGFFKTGFVAEPPLPPPASNVAFEPRCIFYSQFGVGRERRKEGRKEADKVLFKFLPAPVHPRQLRSRRYDRD